jgi:hypothetical protein
MKYTGLNPTDVNRVASGSLGVFVESTQVGTFGTDSLVISGSTLISGSLINIGPQINQGNLTVTGSTILSSSLSVIGTETVTGTLNTVGTLLVTGSAIVSSSLNIIGTESISGALLVTGSTTLSGSLVSEGSSILAGGLDLSSGSAGTLISQSLTQLNSTGSFIYGLNLTPTLTNTAPSQTQTAFRVNAVFTGSYTGSDTSNIIADFGASSVGSQLTITDVTSGSIYMVNDVSGLPIIEALSDWTVKMYNYPNVVFEKTGSALLLGVSGSTGSLVTVQASSSFTAPATFRNDIIFNEGFGATYTMLQVSASTAAAAIPTSSLYTLGLNTSSSVSMIALITGFGTGSRDTITGEIRSTIKRVSGNASIVGTNIRFITADFSGSDANIIVSGSNAILVVTGSTAEPYAWRATITTQIV